MAVQRTVSRRVDVLSRKSPAGIPILAPGWAPERPSPRAAVCSVSSKRLWRKEPQQCARPAGTAAVRGWSASVRNSVSCAAALTGTSSGREQMSRGANCWHLVCASGRDRLQGSTNGGILFWGCSSPWDRMAAAPAWGRILPTQNDFLPRLTIRGLSFCSHLLENNGFLVRLPNNIYAGLDI